MTRDDIIRMAREAGSIDSEEVIETVWNAFAAAALAEREACVKVCEQAGIEGYGTLAAAAMIRARGEK